MSYFIVSDENLSSRQNLFNINLFNYFKNLSLCPLTNQIKDLVFRADGWYGLVVMMRDCGSFDSSSILGAGLSNYDGVN